MKPRDTFAYAGLRLVALSATLFTCLAAHAEDVQGRIEVRGVIGSVTFSVGGAAPAPLHAGHALPIRAVVRTAPGAAADLTFSHNAGVVRLLQNSTLSVDKFSALDASPTASVNLQLTLNEGTMAGFGNKLTGTSKFQVKVTEGIADVGGAKYRLSAKGYLVVVEGRALFVFIPAGGEPVASDLKAPPPVYFSPVEGVRPAPDELVREVVLQTKGKLRG